jgi:hypothetical protein
MSKLTIKDLKDTEVLNQSGMLDLYGGATRGIDYFSLAPIKMPLKRAEWSWDLSTADATSVGDTSTTAVK